jgi:hypothetical protein
MCTFGVFDTCFSHIGLCGVLDKNRTMDNVQKRNICTSIFTYRPPFLMKVSDRSDGLAITV